MIKYFVTQDLEGQWAVFLSADDQSPTRLCIARSEADAHLIASALSERAGERRVGDRRQGGDRRKGDRRKIPAA